jgi:Dinucleotide-utilizing enzymes involved in molybdopterin and thiamine biosynthesis family 2
MNDMQRYSRHLMLPEIGESGQRKLLAAKVLVVGVGGLGSPVSLYLVAAGVGTIGLIDDDVVSLSNLQRQILYGSDEVGECKVKMARNRLNRLSPETAIDIYPFRLASENASEIISKYDIVVDGSDNFATRYLINDTCIQLNKTYVYGSIGAFHGQVSVFNHDGGKNYRDLYPQEAEITHTPSPLLGVMGVVPGIVGCIEASETIKIITGCGTTLSNRLFTIDVLTMQTEIIELG